MIVKDTKEGLHDRVAPRCPHCGGEMDAATMTLEDLISEWPLTQTQARPGEPISQGGLIVSCPTCERPSQVILGDCWARLYSRKTDRDAALEAMRDTGAG